jgi:hypothetical protein
MGSHHLALRTLIVAAASLAGCRQAIGLDAYHNTAPGEVDAAALGNQGAQACGLPYGSAECAACMSASCCPPSQACASDMGCAPYFQCLAGSSDPQRRALCEAVVSTGANWAPLRACQASHCDSECGLTCGDVAPFVEPDAADSCQACTNEYACKSEKACATSVDCLSWAQCQLACSTLDCEQDCTSGNDAGLSLAEAVAASQCTKVCPLRNWDCVGRVSWPQSTSNATTLSATVLDYSSHQKVSGVTAALCSATDPTCTPALAESMPTDATGYLTLDVPPLALPNLDLAPKGYVQVTSPTQVTTLLYWGYPVSEPKAPLGTALFVFTPTELQQMEDALGVKQESSRAIVWFAVRSCFPFIGDASGVQVALDDDPMLRPYYGLPLNPSAAATDSSGLGAFFNVQAGATVTLTATPMALGEASSHATVFTQAGTITLVWMYPTP